MPKRAIEYCVPCGVLDNAIETQHARLEQYGQEIDAVSLSPSHGGVCKVSVDDALVFDKDEHEAGYDLEAIEEAVRTHWVPAYPPPDGGELHSRCHAPWELQSSRRRGRL